MATRIAVIGGGSYQWVPKLLVDIVNTPSLADAHVVLEDIDPVPLPDMAEFARHIASLDGLPLTVSTTTDQRAALEGADYVVVTISTGGFESMRHDLEIPARYGIRQSVGDTVGPGGIMRALRNIPVLLDLASDMRALCPDAWLLDVTNPMTALCRAVTHETSVRTVGLCHEVTGVRSALARLMGAAFDDIDVEIVGVNHLPVVTAMSVGGEDGLGRLRSVLERPARGIEAEVRQFRDHHRVKLALFERYGVLPAAGDRHLVEFFPGFLTEESGWGARWGVRLTTIEDRELWLEHFKAELAKLQTVETVPRAPSGEMVAPLIDSLLRDERRHLPLNLPNAGQCPDLPAGAVVEAMCLADGSGVRGRDVATAPPVLAEWLRRIVASQEATVAAALTGDRDRVVDAMLLDPLAGRIDFDRLVEMTGELITATARWLPQFA